MFNLSELWSRGSTCIRFRRLTNEIDRTILGGKTDQGTLNGKERKIRQQASCARWNRGAYAGR
jgi:hypothetical protein